jgi:hypothetical protein
MSDNTQSINPIGICENDNSFMESSGATSNWRGMLAGIGTINDHPFNPDAHPRAILDAAAKTAFKTSRVLMYANMETRLGALIFPDRRFVDPNRSGADDYNWMDKSGTFRDLTRRLASAALSTEQARS